MAQQACPCAAPERSKELPLYEALRRMEEAEAEVQKLKEKNTWFVTSIFPVLFSPYNYH